MHINRVPDSDLHFNSILSDVHTMEYFCYISQPIVLALRRIKRAIAKSKQSAKKARAATSLEKAASKLVKVFSAGEGLFSS